MLLSLVVSIFARHGRTFPLAYSNARYFPVVLFTGPEREAKR